MSTLLGRILAGGSPFDDRWFTNGGNVVHMDGATLGQEGALKIATVWRAVNVVAAAVAVVPLDVLRRIGAGWEPATDDPYRTKLRMMPNAAQTSYRWRHHLVGHYLLGGNYYAHKWAWDFPEQAQLRPLDPGRMRRPDINADGTLAYTYQQINGTPRVLQQAEVFHARGFSWDGFTGVSVIECMRETVALAAMNRSSRTSFMRNAMRPAVVVKFPVGKEVGEVAERNVQQGFMRAYGGPNKAGLPLVLGDGGDIVAFGINSKEAQFIESENFLVEEFLRYIGVPGVLCGYADKTATHASAESFFQSFIDHCLMPITGNLEQELTTSLYGVQEDIKVRFNLNALLRADATARAAFYGKLVEMGILTRNEVRELENRNPLPGLDKPLTPMNMGGPAGGAGSSATPPPSQDAPQDEPADGGAAGEEGNVTDGRPPRSPRPPRAVSLVEFARAQHSVRATARRIVGRERLDILGADGRKGRAVRFASDPAGWRAWATEYYQSGGVIDAMLVEELGLDPEESARYCAEQRDALLAGGAAVVGTWEAARVPYLVDLAMGRA
jgi:HK97 family phage portal protein